MKKADIDKLLKMTPREFDELFQYLVDTNEEDVEYFNLFMNDLEFNPDPQEVEQEFSEWVKNYGKYGEL